MGHTSFPIKQTTNKQNFMFAHIKPKYSCPANNLSKKRYSRQGKVIVLKIMKISQHNITEADLYSYNLPLSLFPLLKKRQ